GHVWESHAGPSRTVRITIAEPAPPMRRPSRPMKVIALAGLLTCGSLRQTVLPGPVRTSGFFCFRSPPTVAGAVVELAVSRRTTFPIDGGFPAAPEQHRHRRNPRADQAA